MTPKMYTVSQQQIDAMLSSARDQGAHMGWRRGFLVAWCTFGLGYSLAVLLRILG
jgi:hypothetical protein